MFVYEVFFLSVRCVSSVAGELLGKDGSLSSPASFLVSLSDWEEEYEAYTGRSWRI